MLKRSASFVLASLRGSTYRPGKSCESSSGWAGEKVYASPKTLGAHRAAALLDGLFDHPAIR